METEQPSLFFKAMMTGLFIGIVDTIICLTYNWKAEIGHRFTDYAVNMGFRGLLTGIILILGVSSAALPFLGRSRFFEKYVL